MQAQQKEVMVKNKEINELKQEVEGQFDFTCIMYVVCCCI